MKSVMHEASSIAKAIEQAWMKAGQPKEFSIKVLEEPQKNFIGFTTRSAKVALFFDLTQPHAQTKPSQSRPRTQKTSKQHEPLPAVAQSEPVKQPMARKREYKPQWNDAMIDCVKNWLANTLSLMGKSNVHFKIEPSEFYLRITFDNDLLPDQSKEKKLFASFATLIIETLKKTFKTSLRGHKIVLIHANHDSHSRE